MTAQIENRPDTSAGGQLRNYDALKLDLAGAIQRGLRLLDQQAERENHNKVQALVTKLAEDRFVLAVVGQFSRGKSSLMNALMGMDRLPVGIVPLTSVVTKVSYGNPERVLIEYPNSYLKSEIPLHKLPEFVTEAGNPGNQRQIVAAEVQLPSEFLRRGIYFVDTPGIGSAIRENTQTTQQFLPEADAVIFVTAFDSPLGREEIEFLREVREHVRKIFLVVNKLDLVPSGEQNRVLAFIHDRLAKEAGVDVPRLFAVSASEGLEAKLSSSAEGLVRSGVRPLEDALVDFLTGEKTSEFLARVCERAIASIAEIDPPVVLREKASEWNSVLKLLEEVRRQLGKSTSAGRPGTPVEARPVAEADLMLAVRRNCYVCSKVADAMFKYMARFQYQIIMDENERNTVAARGGLCPLHTWQYAEIASPQGISSAYPAVLAAMSQKLLRLAEADRGGDDRRASVRKILPPADQCRACQQQAVLERHVLEDIAQENARAGEKAPSRLPVLCLWHLGELLQVMRDSNDAADLINFEAAILERLADNMRRYALKHDALRRGWESEDEKIAYHRALSLLAGDKRLRTPWHVERLI
jgi:GTP-binding protein EngB required for normal cell division